MEKGKSRNPVGLGIWKNGWNLSLRNGGVQKWNLSAIGDLLTDQAQLILNITTILNSTL